MTTDEVEQQIEDFIRCAQLAQQAGYDGVEIMGSEGYLINQFIVRHTNKRTDAWGGAYRNRIRFPVEIVKRIREAVGRGFHYHLPSVHAGSDQRRQHMGRGGCCWRARSRRSGATMINTGIGWHEARIPTIAMMVPRATFTWVTAKLKEVASVPLITSNRINTPELAETILANGDADMISMARPLLADQDFVAKAETGRSYLINTCIACNQACLDHIFAGKISSCLVNPRACRETELALKPVDRRLKLAVVGAGPAGLSFSVTAARRGHQVVLYDQNPRIGGQLNIAVEIPGKEEFRETLRYFGRQLDLTGVTLRMGTKATAEDLLYAGYDAVIVATGIVPRKIDIEGSDHPCVLNYIDVLKYKKQVGEKVAIIGAGGIGFDTAVYLTHEGLSTNKRRKAFLRTWGVDTTFTHSGGLLPDGPRQVSAIRQVYLLQRKGSKVGASLGKTTGWIHRNQLRQKQVVMLNACTYQRIDDQGLHILRRDEPMVIPVDNVVVCAGQEPLRDLADALEKRGVSVHVIGGADIAAELDAKRAIDQGFRLGAEI